MERRKTFTMNWDDFGDDDDDDRFFESHNRLSSAVHHDWASSSDEDEDFNGSRLSFASAVSSSTSPSERHRTFSHNTGAISMAAAAATGSDYGIWMAAPASITERRKRLLVGMGLADNREVSKSKSTKLGSVISKNFDNGHNPPSPPPPSSSSSSYSCGTTATSSVSGEQKTERCPVSFVPVRSRSEGDIDSLYMTKSRKEKLIGKGSKQRLTRTATEIAMPRSRTIPFNDGSRVIAKDAGETGQSNRHFQKLPSVATDSGVGAFFVIKNLDTGKEFIVNEYGEDGMWNRLSDLQTGKQLTMEEFEKTVGHSPVVNELMRRANVSNNNGYSRKLPSSSYISRSLRMSKRRGAALLKNIKGVASGLKGEREREAPVQQQQQHVTEKETKAGKNKWVRVRQSGKSHKELSALHMCQEFQAHEGCVWTLKFSCDGHYLASAGEDQVIHVWEVQECEVMSLRPEEVNLTPIHPSLLASPDRTGHLEAKKKGKFGSKRGNTIPDYVHVPETVFSLCEKPYCSFQGHLDDVLDLSWSKSQLLLSSSMDKTVRLWDLETKTCLKFFAHNDYVTCIQFNPMDDDYFISGSLDAKVRIWNVPGRHVVDWIDVREMVTAVSYTPDGQAALVGTHRGSCRTYNIEDCKLSQKNTIEIRHKKKSQLRKVTGFQFAPGSSSEVLVTSADSRIRILDGSEVVQKFRGFRNADSQIAASFSPDGRYIISASEDSQVYVWKHEELRQAGSGKGRNVLVTRSHEHFHCKDVSVAIPWPFTCRGDPSPVLLHHSKRHSKRCVSYRGPSSNGDYITTGTDSKRMLPPVPKKSNDHTTESASTPREEEDLETISRTDSGIGHSFTSGSASDRYGDSPSISAATTPSWSSSYSLNDNSHGCPAIHPSAWGLVIVTAGFGGEIRIYQNFGLPRRMSRQAQLFGSPA